MSLHAFLQTLQTTPEAIGFNDTMKVIDQHYDFTETAFRNGTIHNDAGQNNGSCKIFSFALGHGLTAAQTLHCFGDYYRQVVLANPDGDDHQNIRNFMQQGWDGIHFEGQPLTEK